MTFSVAIGNPPYNRSQEDRRTSGNHNRLSGGTVSLAKEFTDLMLRVSLNYCVVLQPYSNKVYSKRVQAFYKSKGLHTITKASQHFNVDVEIGAYYFNRNQIVDTVQDEFVTLEKPADNLGRLFVTAPGALYRNQYEHELLEEGTIKVVVTPNNIKYTNDLSFNDRMQDRTINQWRVAIPQNGSKTGVSSVAVAAPGDILSYSVNCLVVNTEEQATALAAYLTQPEVRNILSQVKTSYTNAKKYFEYIPTPAFLN